ncbi:hypothetical protein [Bordetella genomosp. 9]|nr:hypothetical protein [Bordetella genomosp. 9]
MSSSIAPSWMSSQVWAGIDMTFPHEALRRRHDMLEQPYATVPIAPNVLAHQIAGNIV